MLNILATGSLVADPKERTGTSGKPFVTANARVPSDGEDSILLSLIAFRDSACQALMALTKGDAVAVIGRAKLASWNTAGEQRHGLSVVADQVLTVYQVEKRRSQSTEGKTPKTQSHQASSGGSAPRVAAHASASGVVADLEDDLPWQP